MKHTYRDGLTRMPSLTLKVDLGNGKCENTVISRYYAILIAIRADKKVAQLETEVAAYEKDPAAKLHHQAYMQAAH